MTAGQVLNWLARIGFWSAGIPSNLILGMAVAYSVVTYDEVCDIFLCEDRIGC